MAERTPWRGGAAAGLFLATFALLPFAEVELLALWPSIVALGVALLLQRVLAGLVTGAFAGAMLIEAGEGFSILLPLHAFWQIFETHLLPAFESTWNVGALIFTLVLGGFAGLIEKSGGLARILTNLAQGGTNPQRRVEGAGFLAGLAIFFDGLANALMVGRILRPLADRAGVARVKLAYVVDSTSSAVACVAFVSTWIAYQLAQIQNGLDNAGVPDFEPPYLIFFQSIPYNFYAWFTLILLATVILRRFDIGPMRRFQAGTVPERSPESTSDEPVIGAWRAIVPIGFLIVSILVGIYVDGAEEPWPVTGEKLSNAFGTANAAVVLVVCSALASLVAFAVFPHRRTRSSASAAFSEGTLSLFLPAMILVGAWILSSVLGTLGAGQVLAGLLESRLPVGFLPALVFLAGALTSFSTGSAWGTMGILMPLAVPVAFGLADPEATDPQMVALLASVVGAVFSGAVFGDHCSPISDTTIVSSIACGVEPHEHVATQIPYALIAAGTAVVLGFVPTGFGLPPWISLVAGLAFLAFLPVMVRAQAGSSNR